MQPLEKRIRMLAFADADYGKAHGRKIARALRLKKPQIMEEAEHGRLAARYSRIAANYFAAEPDYREVD